MDFQEFRKSILKTKNKRNHTIKNSLGVRDVFKWCQKNKWPGIDRVLKESEFYKIIRTVNKLIAEELIQGHDVKFP